MEKDLKNLESWIPVTPERRSLSRLRPCKSNVYINLGQDGDGDMSSTDLSSTSSTPTAPQTKHSSEKSIAETYTGPPPRALDFHKEGFEIKGKKVLDMEQVYLNAGNGCLHKKSLGRKQFPHVSRKLGSNCQKIPKKRKLNTRPSLSYNFVPAIKADNGKKDGHITAEKAEESEKAWWEERKFFERRVALFIERMHLVQGDRSFSAWKGSVVDSVVGAFMSQNVSDQSSSSAFMELSAKYQNGGLLPSYYSGQEIDWAKRRRDTLRQKKKIVENVDWDRLRRVHSSREKNCKIMNTLNWEAVRVAYSEAVSDVLVGRGMHGKLAERIRGFLDRLIRDHEDIDLEWLKKVPPHKVKEFLLSIKGLGLKSVDCVQLLALGQPAFPVDTNVARIAVRLGWVPLQPLPESTKLHLLKKYPTRKSVHEFLWPRLSSLDMQTLYELHYHMITFGKVFCTKQQPNCSQCPMRLDCSHFASEIASAKVALPRSKGRSVAISMVLDMVDEKQEMDIEDFFCEDPGKIHLKKFSAGDFTENLKNYQESNIMPKPLAPFLTSEVAFPVPKIKIFSLRRTEHKVFELPDSHPLLERLDKREPGDPVPYLLAIWEPGDFAKNPAESCKSSSLGSGRCCDKMECYDLQDQNCGIILGTLLIPCRTAVRGSFPLNGTFFQVNEVFADDESSQYPLKVSWKSISDLQRRTLYCGNSTSTILKGFDMDKIQECFSRGFLCVRGFNRGTRQPTGLMDNLHRQARKAKSTPKQKWKRKR